jgi:NAD(P)-dependent dehydrogenase (short-subunit alcohol dehydrogenase family)
MAGEFDGKVALVTGGASGIGRASALLFARQGARVAVVDRAAEGGEETVRQIAAAGGAAIFIQADVTRPDDCAGMVEGTVAALGRLDCAFNNAGISQYGQPIPDLPPETWDRVLVANLTSVFLCMKFEIPRMVRQGGGAIVNTSSGYGLVGGRGNAAYVASKHGVIGLSKTAALEWATAGVRVNALCPGWTRSGMTAARLEDPAMVERMLAMEPIGRLAMPEEIAAAVVWLCSDAASFVTGHAMAADGGLAAQ